MRRIIFFLGVAAVVFFFVKWQTKFWTYGDKLTVAIQRGDGSVAVSTFDSVGGGVTTLIIPGDTQVEASRGLGVLKLKNIWQLGVNEGKEGTLLAETLTKNFSFPVFAWADSEAFKKTNLGTTDKINLVIFNLTVQNSKRVEINLAKGSFLKPTILRDGERGYLIGEIPDDLAVVFSDPKVSSQGLRVEIKDGTGSGPVVNQVGSIIQVLGTKVALVTKADLPNLDCEVKGEDGRFRLKVARVLGCKEVSGREGNFDLTITLGKKFAERF